jgi:hypothetical protein
MTIFVLASGRVLSGSDFASLDFLFLTHGFAGCVLTSFFELTSYPVPFDYGIKFRPLAAQLGCLGELRAYLVFRLRSCRHQGLDIPLTRFGPAHEPSAPLLSLHWSLGTEFGTN